MTERNGCGIDTYTEFGTKQRRRSQDQIGRFIQAPPKALKLAPRAVCRHIPPCGSAEGQAQRGKAGRTVAVVRPAFTFTARFSGRRGKAEAAQGNRWRDGLEALPPIRWTRRVGFRFLLLFGVCSKSRTLIGAKASSPPFIFYMAIIAVRGSSPIPQGPWPRWMSRST